MNQLANIIAEIAKYGKIANSPAVIRNQQLHAQLVSIGLSTYLRNQYGLKITEVIRLVDEHNANLNNQ